MNSPISGRPRPFPSLLAAIATAALVSAACGSSGSSTATTQAAEGGASGSPVAAGSSAPVANQLVTAASFFGSATANLADLTSYRFAVAMEGQGVTTEAGTSGGSVKMTGTVVLKPARAVRFDLTASSTDAAASESQLSYVLIGDRAWVGADGMLTEVPAAGAEGMAGSFDAFLPEKLFSTNFTDFASGYKLVGDEEKNGVACHHFQADTAVLEQYATLHGVTGDWHADVWIAKDGGFPVSWAVRGSAAAGGASGTYSMSVDITNINDPANKVTAPS